MRAPLLGGLTSVALLALGSCKDDVGLTSIPPAPERFIAFMSGANEPTPITTPAQGLATVTVNDHVLSYRIELSNIDSAFLAHIHDGRAGTNGGVMVNLYVPPRPATDTGTPNRLVADLVVGLCIGVMVALVEAAARTAWLVAVSGKRAGTQFILATDTGFTGLLVEDTITVVDSVLTLMRKGSGYVNVHTRGPTAADGSGGHGGGEIRGQLFRFQ